MTTEALLADILASVEAASTSEALEAVRGSALGKAGQVTQLMKRLGTLPADERLQVAPVYQALRERAAAAKSEPRAS